MSHPSLLSQVDQVRSLLYDFRSNLLQLPIAFQNQVFLELERVTVELRDWLKTDNQQRHVQTNTHSDENNRGSKQPGSEGNQYWLSLALRQANAGAWKWDLTHHTVQWSPELFDLMGYSQDVDISDPQRFVEMIYPEDRAEKEAEIDAVIQRGGPFILELRIIRGDGRIMWICVTGAVELDETGRPIQAAGINQDITARKEIEEALRISEERERARATELAALMDAVPAIIWISRDRQCRQMAGNRYGYEFLGMWEGANLSRTAPDQELVQQPYRNFMNGQEIPNEELPMQIAAATGKGTSNYEFDLVFRGGSVRKLLGNVVPLLDSDGNPAGAVSAFVDITERKQIEEDLRQSETQLKNWKAQINYWAKATNSFFWKLDADGSYQNRNLVEPFISGKPFEQTQGWQWIETAHPEDREALRSLWQAAIQQQSALNTEARIWHGSSGQYRWFSHRAVPIFEDGVLNGWIGASNDIHAYKEAERALRESEQRFRIALASAPLVVFTLDADRRFTWIYNLPLNLTDEQILGKRGEEILVLEDGAEFVELQQAAVESGQMVQREIKLKLNGDWFHYIVVLDPTFDQRGRLTGLIGAALEITEQRQLEAIHRENEISMATQRHLLQTRENDRVKIARDIHDGPIQTIVSTIFNVQSVLEVATDPQVKAELEPIGRSLKTSVHELRQVINELRPPNLSRFGLAKAVERLIEDLQEKSPGLELVLDLSNEVNNLPEQINLTLYRVCQEALNNVARHSEATRADIHLSSTQKQVLLTIQDNGTGFDSAKDLAKLAEDNHFGLAGMKERAEAIGGCFQVKSKPGKGTTIEVVVPLPGQ